MSGFIVSLPFHFHRHPQIELHFHFHPFHFMLLALQTVSLLLQTRLFQDIFVSATFMLLHIIFATLRKFCVRLSVRFWAHFRRMSGTRGFIVICSTRKKDIWRLNWLDFTPLGFLVQWILIRLISNRKSMEILVEGSFTPSAVYLPNPLEERLLITSLCFNKSWIHQKFPPKSRWTYHTRRVSSIDSKWNHTQNWKLIAWRDWKSKVSRDVFHRSLLLVAASCALSFSDDFFLELLEEESALNRARHSHSSRDSLGENEEIFCFLFVSGN